MQRRIGSLDDGPICKLEDYPLYFAYNVSCIESVEDTDQKFGWFITEDNKQTTSENVYLYLDGRHDDPFGHWVFESAIFLPLFHLLKRKYPTIQILSTNPKKYKEIFYKGLGIDKSEIASKLEPDNTVIFTQWNSLGDHTVTRRKEYVHFVERFYASLVDTTINVPKTINILYMPRGTKENFKSNDRCIPAQEDMLQSIKFFFPDAVILNTDDTTNIRDQITMVRSSKIIVLDYGSSLLVNGFFAEDSVIVVIGDFGHIHCKNPKPYLLLQETLKRGCKYIYVPIFCPASYLIRLLSDGLENGFQSHTHSYNCWKINELQYCEDCSLISL